MLNSTHASANSSNKQIKTRAKQPNQYTDYTVKGNIGYISQAIKSMAAIGGAGARAYILSKANYKITDNTFPAAEIKKRDKVIS